MLYRIRTDNAVFPYDTEIHGFRIFGSYNPEVQMRVVGGAEEVIIRKWNDYDDALKAMTAWIRAGCPIPRQRDDIDVAFDVMAWHAGQSTT